MSNLAMFNGVANGWHHLHLGVVEPSAGYRLRDTSLLLEQAPVGETGASLRVIDDEPPVINAIEFVQDRTTTSVVQQGACGDEVFGPIDIIGDIYDTFFTSGTFATFPGLGTLPDSTGVRTARYLVRSLATRELVSEGTWYDMEGAPVLCSASTLNRGCLLSLPADEATWLQRVSLEAGAFSPGLTILDALFDTQRSASFYFTRETYLHILTNAGAEEGAWTATTNGRYQVTVEAADFAGNSTALTRFVTVRDPATTLDLTAPGFGDVFVKDHRDDVGAVPSNLGGQPFWESPDIILVPAGTPNVTVDTPATQSSVTAGAQYWIFVRINNNGCSPIENVKARTFSADPSAINTNWHGITPGTEYVGDAAHPEGVTVPPFGRALLGPFSWVPSAEDAQFGGHRCLLAAVSAPGDEVEVGQELDAPNHNNVGQRNLQVGSCAFQLPNPTASSATLGITLTTDAKVDGGEVVEVFFPFDGAWLAAWSFVPEVAVQQSGSELVVRLLAARAVLPDVSLAASQTRTVSFALTLPSGTPTRTVRLTPTLNGASLAGVSCEDQGGPIVH